MKEDASAHEPDIEEHDAAAITPDDDAVATADAGSPAAEPAHQEDASAAPDGTVVPPDDPRAEAGVMPGAGAMPGAGGQLTDGGAPGAGSDAAASRPSAGDLIDAVGDTRKERTDKICSCPAAGQECVRAGFGKSSCLERGIMLLSGASEESVRTLLECMLPAEKAYTECVNTRLRCLDAQTSTSTCGLAYELATARCNTSSIQGLSLQGLCSR